MPGNGDDSNENLSKCLSFSESEEKELVLINHILDQVLNVKSLLALIHDHNIYKRRDDDIGFILLQPRYLTVTEQPSLTPCSRSCSRKCSKPATVVSDTQSRCVTPPLSASGRVLCWLAVVTAIRGSMASIFTGNHKKTAGPFSCLYRSHP